MRPVVQISLDLTNLDEAIETAELAMRAGVDWLEAGTPFILAEGLHGVKALRKHFRRVSSGQQPFQRDVSHHVLYVPRESDPEPTRRIRVLHGS